MTSEHTLLISGIILGLGSGLTPGPLLTLVISETLKHGIKEGIKVSIAPLLTDLPIVLGIVFILSRLSDIMPILGVISFSGAAYLVFLSLELIAFKGIDVPSENMRPHSLTRGMIANFLNPAPYMFWFTVGAPLVVKASVSGPVYVIFFIGSFYVLLVGSKMIVSMVAEKSRHFLHSKHYVYTMKVIGILLLIFSAVFIRNGLKYFHLL